MKTGDTVQWMTRSQGRTMLKKGAIVFVIKPNQPFANAVTAWGGSRDTYYLKVFNRGTRDRESYAVLIQECGRPRMTLYWPLVASIELVRSAA